MEAAGTGLHEDLRNNRVGPLNANWRRGCHFAATNPTDFLKDDFVDIILINPTPPLPGGHDGGTRIVYWVLRYLRDRGHTIRVIFLENPDLDGKFYSDVNRELDYNALREIGVEEVRSIPIPSNLWPETLRNHNEHNVTGFCSRLRRSVAYRLDRLRAERARSNLIAENLKSIADEMRGDVCFSFVEILKDIRKKPAKPLVSWMFQTGEPYLKIYIDFGLRKVLGSQILAKILYPIILAAHHRHLARTCKNADHMIAPILYYANIWEKILKGRTKVHYFPHPAEDESGALDSVNPTLPPERGMPYRVVLFGHLRAALTTAGLVHFTDHILPALDRAGRQDDFEFHIVGKFEPYPFVAQKLQRPNIHFKGFVKNFAETLNDAHAVLVPIPVPPGSGMRLSSACSVSACIVTHHAVAAGAPEFVSGENCLMASSGEEFARALVLVCEDRDLNQRLRVGARSNFDKNYRMEDSGPIIENILNEAIRA